MKVDKKKKPKGKGCKLALFAFLFFTACGGGGGDETTNVYNNCGNRSTINAGCNIGSDEVGTDEACNKCGQNFIDCVSNPSENGLTDDSLCNDIFETCKEINACEVE